MTYVSKYTKQLKLALVMFCTLACIYLLVLPLIFSPPQAAAPNDILLNNFDVTADGVPEAENADMPYTVKTTNCRFIDFYTLIPETEFDVTALKFMAYLKNVWVYVDGELIYENVFTPTWFNSKYPGSATCVAVLPANSEGRQLQIRFERLIGTDHGSILPFTLTNGAIDAKNAHPFTLLLFSMISLVFVSVGLMLLALLYRKLKINVRSLLSLALTIFSVSCWTLCNTKMIEIFTLNRVFIHNLEYLSFFILPLALLSFVKQNWEKCTFLLKLAVNTALAFYAFSLVLRLFFKIDFYSLITIFHFFVIFYVIAAVHEIVATYKTRPASFKIFCLSGIALTIAVVFEIYFYYNKIDYAEIGSAFMFGLGIMSVMLLTCYAISSKEQLDAQFANITNVNMEAEHIRYEILMSNNTFIFIDWQIENDIVYFSHQYESYFGTKPVTKNFMNFIDSGGIDNYHLSEDIDSIFTRVTKGSKNETVEGWFIHPSGSKKWFELSISAVFNADSLPERIIGLVKDITPEKILLEEFKNRAEYIKINDELYDSVLEADITKNIITNKNCFELAEMLGFSKNISYVEILDLISERLVHPDFQDEYRKVFDPANIMAMYERNVPSFIHECIERFDGVNYLWTRLTVCIYKSDITNTVRIITYVKNIESEKTRELELLTSSRTDALSGVLNKAAIKEAVNSYFSKHSTAACAFVMLDADNFKTVNDTMGHVAGDKVIQEFGKRLKEICASTDIIGRIGGDEFAILLKNVSSSHEVEVRCERLLRKIKSTVTRGEQELTVSMSMGVCLSPKDGSSFDELYSNADAALYRAKSEGRNRFNIY